MALIDKLSAIGNAIREKTGKDDLLTLDQMPTEIQAIETGGGDLPEEGLLITGNCNIDFIQVDGIGLLILMVIKLLLKILLI